MGLSAIKREQRLALHERMGEPCSYARGDVESPTPEQLAAGLTLTARFHNKIKLHSGDNDGVSVLEGIEKLVFNSTQLAALGLELEHGAEITFPGYELSVILDQEMDPDGPENVYWTVTRA